MTVTAFEGPAGTGKTHSLMNRLQEGVAGRELAAHERVLALTFMHGSRRRLDSRLRDIDALARRFQATTVDSFAWRIVQRWGALARHLDYQLPTEEQYEQTCALAAALMARPEVASWIAVSYPFVLVDEAQDLSHDRSTMIAEMTGTCELLLAYDEFQCLNPALRPMPIRGWLPRICEPTSLTICRRTNNAELLEAARSVRDGQAVRQNGRRFRVMATPGKPNFAATCLANAIAWRQGGGTVAVLTPSRRGGFADGIVELVRSGPIGKHQNGPYPIQWENSEEAQRNALLREIAMPEACSVADALAALEPHSHAPAVKATRNWIGHRKRVLGIDEVSADEVRGQINRSIAMRRRYAGTQDAELSAMTIQQAKNREFDHVIVIWPYTVPNDDEQKRRLLYNAITRAKCSCQVLVQAQELLSSPPFTH